MEERKVKRENCAACKFFKPAPKKKDVFNMLENNECRRYAPDKRGEWPYVKETDWCGEFIKKQKACSDSSPASSDQRMND